MVNPIKNIMSEFIYGSSLQAAKSKANYLFEGDFRRRPNQNLSGASRSLARGELLQQAAEQRQSREDTRKREQASVKIQSAWRGHQIRKILGVQMRNKFDDLLKGVKSREDGNLNESEFSSLTREFVLYYHSSMDEERLDELIDLILKNENSVFKSKEKDSKGWCFKITKLLKLNLKLIEKHCSSADSKYLAFLERFTRVDQVLHKSESCLIWASLIESNVYSVLRQLVITSNKDFSGKAQISDDQFGRNMIELLRRSLEIEPTQRPEKRRTLICSFFHQFLKGPLDDTLDKLYLPELLKLQPIGLQPAYVLETFEKSQASNCGGFKFATSFDQVQQCSDSIWLCYSFIRTIYTQLDQFSEHEKVNYINILSFLISPAEYITNLSLMQAANNEDTEPDEEESDELSATSRSTHIYQYHTEINNVITRLINIINELPHINNLKTIVFSNELQPQVQRAIIQICNLMLAHEPLAIFNCRLLYTVAFSREFSRSLWKSIITSTSMTIYGTNTPIYLQLTRGNNINQQSWESILPQLRLFCSLYSYLLPTLDDEEFYTDDEKSIFTEKVNQQKNEKQQQNITKHEASSSFFIDKELVNISAVLKDMCVGFIEILYHDNKHAFHHSSIRFEQNFQDERSRLLSFEVKLCFKALVRLIRQLHARDSRKQFCPEGHWICPSMIVPANRAIDFQLVTSQQGRLISQMTKDDNAGERASTTASEVKTVLILQEIPFVVSFHDRVQILHHLLKKDRLMHQSDGYHFGLPGTAILVQIRRNYIYEDAFEKLSYENEPNMKLPLKVSMVNAAGVEEAGIDGGGLSKEFLGELLKAGFDPMRGFFKSTKDQLLYPNPSANVLFSTLPGGYEIHYEFLGRMLGKAIFEKIMVELPLASFFLAKLLARRHSSDVDLHNLASLDPILYKNLVYLKNYKGDVADLNLDFTISNNELGEHEVVELKPGGSKIPVTRENKIEYVHLVADYRLNKQIRAQCAAFKRGLAQLVDLDWLRMFDSRELQILISGAPTVIDIEDWRRHTLYANGYSDECEAISTFWRVTSQFDENQKRKLLKFATSCSLPPLLGFKDLVPQFTIAPTEETRLPTASTCMNLLKLPQCEDDTTMRSKLLYAIESNSGFELS